MLLSVFIPELNENTYQLLPKETKIKQRKPFGEIVKEHRIGYEPKTVENIQKEAMEETLRLLYVGFTRAREELYVSCNKKYKNAKVSCIFEEFMGEKQ